MRTVRPLEILLLAAELVTFALLLLPRHGRFGWLRPAGLLPLVAMAAQLLAEGQRWQMFPAYAMGLLLSLAWLLRIVRPGQRLTTTHWPARLIASAGVLGLVVSAALPSALPVFHFPTPSGPYQIGTTTYYWVDTGRHEIFSPDAGVDRALVAQVWYPVLGDSSRARAAYVPDAGALSPVLARLEHLPPFTFDYLGQVRTDAIPSAPIASAKARYPVLIYLTGLGGFAQVSTFQVEQLVSEGYVVVGLDQPYAAAAVVFPGGREATVFSPRGRMQTLIDQSISPSPDVPELNGHALPAGIIPYLAQDVSFTIDRLTALDQADPHGILTGHLDLSRIGVFGISLGAMVGADACHADARIRACLLMDAAMPADVVKSGLRQPAMWITRNAATMRLERQRSGGWAEWQIRQTLTTMREVFAEGRPGRDYYVQVPGIFHVEFTDAPLFTPLATQVGLSGTLGVGRAHQIINAYSVAFFDHVLEGGRAPERDGLAARFPEARMSVS